MPWIYDSYLDGQPRPNPARELGRSYASSFFQRVRGLSPLAIFGFGVFVLCFSAAQYWSYQQREERVRNHFFRSSDERVQSPRKPAALKGDSPNPVCPP